MIELLKLGVTIEQFNSLDYRQAELLRLSLLKSQEEQINNNIMTGAKSAAKVIEFYTASKHANDMHFVDYEVQFEDDAIQKRLSQHDLKVARWQYNELKRQGVNPVEWLREQRAQEEEHG